MRRTIQRQKAEAFHRLHAGDGMLVLVNAWDAASARLFEQAGSPAIATTGAGSVMRASSKACGMRRRLICQPPSLISAAIRIPASLKIWSHQARNDMTVSADTLIPTRFRS